jgi:hypothetical protein
MSTAYAQDAMALCARLGTDDRLRPLSASLVPEARRLFGISGEAPDAFVQKSTTFRCMNGKVWLCNYGANLVCGKANTSKSLPGAEDFCRQNPDAAAIPMAATGHDTVYEWTCAGDRARISRQVQKVDPRGFIAANWKELR